jgi:hypothetical protein
MENLGKGVKESGDERAAVTYLGQQIENVFARTVRAR